MTQLQAHNNLSSYTFHVPEELIAQNPKDKRDQSKLLIRQANGEVSHHCFSDLEQIIPEGSLLVLNETKVFSCRLLTKTPTGGKIEIFLLENPLSKNSSTLKALVRPSKKAKPGMELCFGEGINAKVISQEEISNIKLTSLEFNLSPEKLAPWLEEKAKIPLPPYIKRDDSKENSEDKSRYQTIYAGTVGSVAAPTAGLHFTQELLDKLKKKNIEIATVTLHVGLGTFLPIKEQDITKHKMHEESYVISQKTLEALKRKKAEGKKIIYVGTTTLRSLESFFRRAKTEIIEPETLCGKWLQTNLYIHPTQSNEPYQPSYCDALLTNFHQPSSSLFLLVCALIGKEEALKLYKTAVSHNYRFYSYGDASLLFLKP